MSLISKQKSKFKFNIDVKMWLMVAWTGCWLPVTGNRKPVTI